MSTDFTSAPRVDGDLAAQRRAYITRANQTTDSSLAATRRMLPQLEETRAVGVDTIDELVRQGEQLDRIEDNLDDIGQGVRQAETHIEEMNKCCGLFTPPWKRWKKFEKIDAYKEKEPKGGQGREAGGEEGGGGRPPAAEGRYVEKIMGDNREEEMEDNLKQVGAHLEGLKAMAVDMGGAIERQNEQIEGIHVKAEANEIGIARNQHRLDKMLR